MRVDGVSAIDSDDPLHEVPTQLARVGWLLPNPEKAFLVYGTVHLNTMQEYSVTSAGGDGPFGEGPALTDAARWPRLKPRRHLSFSPGLCEVEEGHMTFQFFSVLGDLAVQLSHRSVGDGT